MSIRRIVSDAPSRFRMTGRDRDAVFHRLQAFLDGGPSGELDRPASGYGIWSLRRDRVAAAGKFLVSALLLVLVIGLVPVGQLLIRPLEMRFPAAPDISVPVGIIILGGAEDARMSAKSGLPELNAAGERLILGLSLAQAFPEAQLFFTGGSASLVDQSISGTDGAQALFFRFEIADSRITLEPNARNTAENATRTYGPRRVRGAAR